MSDSVQQFRIAEIEVAKSLTDEKIIGIFRFEATGRAKQGPTLLLLADVQSSLYAYERLLDVLNATAEQARYLVSQVDQDPLGRFEKLVQRMNEAVAAFVGEEAVPVNWNRINIFLLELSEGHMCFTGTGRLMNIFLQKQEDGSFRAFDLFGSLEQPRTVDPAKPFATVICGDIKPGDVLIAGSTNLERLRSELRMKERLTTLPPVTAALEIRQDLERRGIPDDFVAVIIASLELKTPTAELPPTPEELRDAEKDKSTLSVEKLRKQEAETTHRLSPATPIEEMKNTSSIVSRGTDALKKTGSFALTVLKTLTSRARMRDPMSLASLRGMNAGYGTVFTKKRKTALLAAGGILILVIAGSLWWRQAKKTAAETATWNAAFDNATDQRNRAESDLVYGNEARAREEIANAEKLAESLPSDNPDRDVKMKKLSQDLKDLKERLKKIVKTENVMELVALAAAANPGSLTAPVLVKDTVYAVDQSTNNILKISVLTKETKRIPLPTGAGTMVAANEGKDNILFATDDGKLYALNKSSDLVKPMSWSHVKSSSTRDVVLYNSRLYSLDPGKNQIWLSQQDGGSFGSERAWIKASSATIDAGVAIAIDANVFVLKSDGTIIEFLTGGQVSFGLYPIDPPLRAASNMWTDVDSTNLYITDPADKRVLVYDKSGTLKAQFTSSQFKELRDISVDETNKRMVVTDGNRLLLVPLP